MVATLNLRPLGDRVVVRPLEREEVTKSGIDREFQNQVRDMVQPGTSALFLVIERATPDEAVESLRRFGGTVLKSSLSKEAEADLQAALHGEPTPSAA